jgi:hypothetical protein
MNLLEKLRNPGESADPYQSFGALCREAADEIDRLYEIVARVRLAATCEGLSADGYKNALAQVCEITNQASQ